MLNWHKSSLPNHVQLRVSVDNGSSYRIVAQSSVPSHDSAEMYMPLETPVLATNLSCICTGFAKCNQEQNRSHKLERVRVHKPVPGVPNVSTRLLVQTMTAWLTKVASAPPNNAYAGYVPPLASGLAAPASAPPSGYALAALEMMALASGSLDTLLTLVNLLFSKPRDKTFPNLKPVEPTPSPAAAATTSLYDGYVPAAGGALPTGAWTGAVLTVADVPGAPPSAAMAAAANATAAANAAATGGIAAAANPRESMAGAAATVLFKTLKARVKTVEIEVARSVARRADCVRTVFKCLANVVSDGSGGVSPSALGLTRRGRGVSASSDMKGVAILPVVIRGGSAAWDLTMKGVTTEGVWLGVGRLVNGLGSGAPVVGEKWIVEAKQGKLRMVGGDGNTGEPTEPHNGTQTTDHLNGTNEPTGLRDRCP